MIKILVTGGAGYIGSILVPKLLEAGFKVTVLDNFLYRQPSLASVVSHKNLAIEYGDVRDQSVMTRLLSNSDVVIPLAAIVGAPACKKDPITASSINKDATLWLIDKLSPDQQIIMPTTNSAYGHGDKNNFCDENSKLNPLSLYAQDKVDVEKHLMEKNKATSFRLATVFGISPRMRLDLLVNNFVYRALTDKFIILFEGHFKRNYVHIKDVAEMFIFSINNPELVKNQIFNFGLSQANISKQELCEIIKTHLHDFVYQDAPLAKDPDQRNYIVSNKKIEAIGLKAKVSLNEGISELIKGLGMFTANPYTNLS
jgi:nucleoside-diphosphate-sugar epimerase